MRNKHQPSDDHPIDKLFEGIDQLESESTKELINRIMERIGRIQELNNRFKRREESDAEVACIDIEEMLWDMLHDFVDETINMQDGDPKEDPPPGVN